jgi:MFS family permease
VIILTAMNLLNYIDRYVPSAVKDLFKKDLGFTDLQTSLPLSAFIIVYMLASPVFGGLADRRSRRVLIMVGVVTWSLATAGAALATGFLTFLFARALVGVGEAAYATIGPALLSDFYPPDRRNRVFTIFYMAIPVGAALGFTLGGILGAAHGWRSTFLMVGLPGLLAAAAILLIDEPPRGQFDRGPVLATPDWPEALRALRRNAPFVFAVAGYAAATWAGGGMADWFPTYLLRYRGMTLAQANTITGAATVVGGLAGTLTGGLLADRLRGRARLPYFLGSWAPMVPAAGFALVAIFGTSVPLIATGILLAQFFLWFYNSPINTVIVNAVAANMRARAVSISILTIHILGDAVSPPIIGRISDRTGNLTNGIVLIPVMMLVAALIWAFGWWRLRDTESAAAPSVTAAA